VTGDAQTPKRPSEQTLLAEYAAANGVYLQYDGFRWQAGSFLIAGVFVYWGFLIQAHTNPVIVGVSSLLVASLMSCWILFANHYRQLYLQKLHRMHEIELLLGMEQHLRFTGSAPSGTRYRSNGIKGHNIDIIVYLITAAGGSVLAWVKNGFSLWDLGVIPLAAIVVWHVERNERKLAEQRAKGFGSTMPGPLMSLPPRESPVVESLEHPSSRAQT
jgi:hypothetical protein